MKIYCGVAKKTITPKLDGSFGDFYLAGYATMNAPKIQGILDPIYVRSMVLSDGKTKIALVSVEVIGLLRDFVVQIKELLTKYHFSSKNIFIFSSHTHAAPDTMGLWGPLIGISGINKRYMGFLLQSIVSSVLEAEEQMVPIKIFYTETERIDLVKNYRNKENLYGDLKIIKFQSNDSLIGTLWTFTAQPEITNRLNKKISGDYPGIVSNMIEEEFGGVALFGLGLCGAQQPIYCEEGYKKLENYAETLFNEIKNIFTAGKQISSSEIEIRNKEINLPITNEEFLLLFTINIFKRKLVDGELISEISKIRIGNLHLINFPGEPFPNLVLPIINNYKQDKDHYIPLSCVNDELGYFIPKEEYKLKTLDFKEEMKDKEIEQEKKEEIKPKKFIGHENESISYEAATRIKKHLKDLLIYKTIMAISCHADDITIWAGGTLKKLVSEGNNLICVRIANDYGDSFGMSKERSIKRNLKDCERAYKQLGASIIEHLMYDADTLAGVDYLELRGKLIYLIRKYKPNVVVSFDLNGYDEENMDHITTARAVNEACWQSSVDQFYPQHFDDGLEIHAVGERYLFARNPEVVNFSVDITDYMDEKINVLTHHKTAIDNMFLQYKMLARANNLYIDLLEEEVPDAIRVNLLMRFVNADTGKKYGVKYAEEFNKIGTGFLEDFASE